MQVVHFALVIVETQESTISKSREQREKNVHVAYTIDCISGGGGGGGGIQNAISTAWFCTKHHFVELCGDTKCP